MKALNVYGIEMNEIENMRFSKFMSNNNIAMNTKTAEERKHIASDWLKEQKTKTRCPYCGKESKFEPLDLQPNEVEVLYCSHCDSLMNGF